MRVFWISLLFATGLSAQSIDTASDTVQAIVGRLDLERYKADIKGLAQFGDRMVGTPRNREAIAWLEHQLEGFGYTNVTRQPFSGGLNGPLENLYATKVGLVHPDEMYIVSAHMDGLGGGEAADDDASGCAVVLELARVLASPDIQTDRSIRFIFWNSEETGMDGSANYARQRGPLQSTGDEPRWLGVIQHDMMMYDHGFHPGPEQRPDADINIEFDRNSTRVEESARLAALLQAANKLYAHDYPATIGMNMAGTDSVSFKDAAPSVSVREAERRAWIVRGSNPNHHKPTDNYDTYSEKDFALGFDAARTTLGALGHLAGLGIRGE